MKIGPALIHFYFKSTSAEKLQYFFSHCAAKKSIIFDFAPMPALSLAQNQHCRPAEKSQSVANNYRNRMTANHGGNGRKPWAVVFSSPPVREATAMIKIAYGKFPV